MNYQFKMLPKWLDGRKATEVGNALADEFVLRTAPDASGPRPTASSADLQRKKLQQFLQKFLQRVDHEAGPLQLNVFQRAKLANSFKWRLLEKGVEPELVEELTEALVRRLTGGSLGGAQQSDKAAAASARRPGSGKMQALLAQGDEYLARGASAEAADCYQQLLSLDPRHVVARNNLGVVLCKLGRYKEAEEQFRRAVGIKPGYAEAQSNLGTVLRWRGRVVESEMPLRRALKVKPVYVDAQINLSATLLLLGRWGEAKTLLEKALRTAPRNVDVLVGLGQIAGPEGRLADAEALFKRAAELDPKAPSACAAMVWVRKMTPSDAAWAKHAEQVAAEGLAPLDESNIRYAIGKYYDDVADYKRAFRSYSRANELQKLAVEPYDRAARTRFVDDMIRVYTREALAVPYAGASDSTRPVLVVGMPRSGTSLVEQIIASHPAAKGAGELAFWSDSMRTHDNAIRQGPVAEPLRKKFSTAYLRILAERSADAVRIVDKATFNSEYLGVIHTVFPNARMIYLRRNPIDTCLSCYFQQLSAEMNFAMDLSDLAHYYREHQRLVAHWRSALPAGALLEVPYAELVANQEAWTRKILDFIGLEWDERCLQFDKAQRTVSTASYWQVRQKIYNSSVNRWRNYEEFIAPLRSLRDETPS